ncbi:neurofilament medium polypeptide isoform X1 [Drosophila willistoni]|uniref:neurofilament medium polypeptide isoform X1 n=1 Tax=Drosophila willistoni TaxID=7260 RepID=UPI00017D77D8|nr:neurofilament medium polypeptide isoform X1 [Drosophila willistoni]
MEESNFAKKKEETQTQTQTPEQMREEEMAAIAAKENQQVSKDDTLKGSEPPKKWEAKKEIDKTESKSSKIKDNEVMKESDKPEEEKETIEESKPSKQEESPQVKKEPESPKEIKKGENISKNESENLKKVEPEENKKEVKDEPENSVEDEKKIEEAKPLKEEDKKHLESPKAEKEPEPKKEEETEEPEKPKEKEKIEDPKPTKKELKKAAKEAEKQERIEKARAKRAQEEANKQSAGEITDEDVPQRTVDKGWALAQATDDKKEVRVSDDSKADSSSDTTGKSKKSSWFNFSLIKREPSRFKPTINPDHPSSSPQSVDNAIKLRKAKQRYKQEMAHLRQSYEYRLGLVRQLKQELKSNFKSDQQQLHSSYQLQIHDREIGSSAEPSSESDSTRKPEVQDNKDDKAST